MITIQIYSFNYINQAVSYGNLAMYSVGQNELQNDS